MKFTKRHFAIIAATTIIGLTVFTVGTMFPRYSGQHIAPGAVPASVMRDINERAALADIMQTKITEATR